MLLARLLSGVIARTAIYQAIAGTIASVEAGSGTRVCTGILYYDSDGGVRRFQETAGTGSTVSIGNWSSAHPNEAGGASWSVRVTHQTGTDTYDFGDGLGVWLALGSDRLWRFQRTLDEFEIQSGTYLVEISADGGTTVFDSETLTVSLTHEGP